MTEHRNGGAAVKLFVLLMGTLGSIFFILLCVGYLLTNLEGMLGGFKGYQYQALVLSAACCVLMANTLMLIEGMRTIQRQRSQARRSD